MSGRYVYSNPGGDLTSTWPRVDLAESIDESVDAMLITDVDGDRHADVIATALPDVWWLEATSDPDEWTGRVVASVPPTGRPNGQGYRLGDLTGDGKDEIILSGGESEAEVWYVQIPEDPEESWPTIRITDTATDEQVGVGDIDGDGLNDVAAGDMHDGGAFIVRFENPGDGSDDWVRHRLGEFPGEFPDRLDLADFDGDDRIDVVVTEEDDGSSPDAEVAWYRQPDDPKSNDWVREVIVTQYTTNGLDVADLDGDGDPDLTTGEHRGSRRVSVWENEGADDDGVVRGLSIPSTKARRPSRCSRGDLDGDGDLEIVSIGFDDSKDLHLWINV